MAPAVWPLVVRLLARAIPARHLPPVFGDLIEDYGRRVAVRGRVRAELWLFREAISLSATYRLRGRLTRPRPETWIGHLRSDLLHAWRAIRARPLAAMATASVLALGIGLVSAMFALADPYLFRPLPFERPHELVWVNPRTFATSHLPRLADWRARGDLFTAIAASGSAEPRDVTADDRQFGLRVAAVSAEIFDVLGVPVRLAADWTTPSASGARPVVLTAAAARRLFGRQAAVSRTLRSAGADKHDLRVVDVLPSSFVDPFSGDRAPVDGFIPLAAGQPLIEVQVTAGGGFRASSLFVLARLRPGVTPAAVEQALATAQWTGGMLPTDGVAIQVRRLGARATEAAEAMARGLLAAGLLILAVCIANVANLLLARGALRTREFAAREALGASRLTIARLVLAELASIAVLGVVLGLAVAKGALLASTIVIPAEYVTLGSPDVSSRVVMVAVAGGALVMAAGMLPAWAAWRVTPSMLVAQTTSGETRVVRALRFSMTMAQTTVAVVLLVGAALLGRSFLNLATQDPGYDGDTFALDVRVPRESATRGPTSREIDQTAARLARLPGVMAAGATTGSLVGTTTSLRVSSITLAGRRVKGSVLAVSAGFFEATRSRLLDGRLPAADDWQRTAVVTRSFADSCCPSVTALGQVVQVNREGFEIVGIIRDVQTRALDEAGGPAVFVPIGDRQAAFVTYVMRAARADGSLALAAEREVLGAHGAAIVSDASTMRARLMRSVNDRSFATLIAVFLAVAAIGVSAAGLVGVVTFMVARRTREIAIRIAIGATGADVVRHVTSEATTAAGVGTVLGLAGAWSMSRALEGLLFGVAAADVGTFALTTLAVVGIVGLAAWVPARRALRLSPSAALRAE
jgi:predicted permease